jgi:TonB-linked SusC/RagA family outer membrane protein
MRVNYNYFKIIIPFFMLIMSFGYAQQKTVSGTITSATDGIPLPGVSIIIKGTTTGVSSDFDGKFTINVDETNILQISSLGFAPQEISVEGLSTINVILEEDSNLLEEIIVTGYTTQSRTTLTTAIEKIDAEPLQNSPAGGSAVNALTGRVSGVTIVQTTGRAGDQPIIQIRGGTTPNATGDTPLFIVDGFVQDDMGDVDMNDVEEFTILKDAAAAAIYGAKGGNGVVIIKTRRGKKGKMSVSIKYSHESQNIDRFKVDFLTPEEEIYFGRLGFVNYQNALADNFYNRSGWWSSPQPIDSSNSSVLHWADDVAAANGGQIPDSYVTTADPITGRLFAWEPTDWQERTLTPGTADNYNFNINGGSDKAIYNLSMSLYDNVGVGVYNKYRRYYMKGSSDIELNDKLKAGFDFRYSFTDTQTGEGNTWYQRSGRQPTTQRYINEDGSFHQNNSGKRNPDFTEENLIRGRYNTDVNLGTYFEWNIIEGLTFKPRMNLRQRSYSFGSMVLANSLDGTRRNQDAENRSWIDTQFDALLTYDKSFNEVHNTSFLAGTSFRNGYDYRVWGNAFNGPSDLTPVILGASVNEDNDIQSTYTKSAIQSWFGQASYNFKQKYLFNASVRYDGAHQFTEANQFGLFTGFSGGWNAHKEDWWSDSSIGNYINKFKLTTSYGESGKNNLSINDTRGAYSTTSYGGLTGIRQTTLVNEDLVWETTQETDFAVELGILNKVNLSFEYYDKKAIDRLFLEPLPSYTGFTGIRQNIGTFGTKGLDIGFNTQLMNTEKFQWNVSGFADFITEDRTLKLPDNGNPNNRISGSLAADPNNPTGPPIDIGGFAEGERWGAIYGFVEEGVVADWADADAYNAMISFDEFSNLRNRRGSMKIPGDYKWKDLNGDGIISSLDQKFLGWTNPDKHFSLANDFSYKTPVGDFTLSILLEAFTGHVVSDYTTPRTMSQAQGGDRLNILVRNSYLQPGDESSGYARYGWADLHTLNNFNRGFRGGGDTRWTQNADHIAIRNIALNYTLPEDWVSPAGLSEVKAFVVGSNLGYITNYKGATPQARGRNGTSSFGEIYSLPPVPLVVNFGVEVKF